jgi:4-cresol dehydrogenase (hydroxylating)
MKTSGRKPSSHAVAAWTSALGERFVVRDEASLSAAETATFLTRQKIIAILRPKSVADVQTCLRVAMEHRTPLYPISGGKNWGYGSRVPPSSGCALLDLSRLDRITGLDRKNGVVRVQPGVTQGRLAEFVQKEAPEYWVDTTTSSPAASILANVLERGHGHTLYGDHIAYACGFEVVLPNGDLVRTGSARFPGCRAAHLDRCATGPMLDGLFVQSNLGIVTEMAIWLMPAPETVVIGRIHLDDDIRLVLDAFRELKFSGAPISGPQIFNDYRQIQRHARYPWDLTGGKTPLPQATMRRLAEAHGVPRWSVLFGIYGADAIVSGVKKTIVRKLGSTRPKFKVVVRDHERLGLDVFRDPKFGAHACFVGALPGPTGLLRTYWRKRGPTPAVDRIDPDRDGCGMLWVTPIVPFQTSDIARANAVITKTSMRHGFEPAISFSHVRDRAVHYYASVTFDRDVPGEDARALACHSELTRRLAEAGYYPHRLPIASMKSLELQQHGFSKLQAAIKRAVDPTHILAPGRYESPEVG